MNKSTTICVTGGHVSPALATIEHMQMYHKDWRIFAIGRDSIFDARTDVQSEESRLFASYGVPFYPIKAGRLYREFTARAFMNILLAFSAFAQSIWVLLRNKPDVVVTFGGYVSFPVGIAAYVLRIPLIIHEQTSVLGGSNRVLARYATKTCINFEHTIGLPKSNKAIVTGLPQRRLLQSPPSKPSFHIEGNLPIIYCMGGASGSFSLNKLLYPLIEELIKKFFVVHQVGRAWTEEAHTLRSRLPHAIQSHYMPVAYVDIQDHSWLLRNASVLISRAGANATMECAYSDIPTIFFPLPWAAYNEQWENAMRVKSSRRQVFDQQKTTPQDLLAGIISLYEKESKKTPHPEFPYESSKRFVDIIKSVITHHE